jgi:hypothetical protein
MDGFAAADKFKIAGMGAQIFVRRPGSGEPLVSLHGFCADASDVTGYRAQALIPKAPMP